MCLSRNIFRGASNVVICKYCNHIFFCLKLSSSINILVSVVKANLPHLVIGWSCKKIGMCRASDFPREYDGACLQMRMSYSPAAHLFLFLVQWTDCHLAGALGLLRILIYKVRCFWFLGVDIEMRDLDQMKNLPHVVGLCGWNNHHVYTWKKSKY